MLVLYSPDMYVGHHTAFQCGIKLFRGDITPEKAMATAEVAVDKDCDLEYGMIVYAVTMYESMRGNTGGFTNCLDQILRRDTFWSGFAWHAALNDRHPEIAENAQEDVKR